MILIKEENFNKVINNQEIYDFEVFESSLYLISVSAKCKNWLQNFRKLFNDDDLAIEIDEFPFFEFMGKRKEFTSPTSWNGNELKGSSKTNFYLIPLSLGKHKIRFFTDQEPFLGNIKIYKLELNDAKTLNFTEEFLPKVEKSKLFFNIAVKKLNSIKVLVKADEKDKLGLEVNKKIITNNDYKKYKKWYWLGTQLKGKSKELIEQINSNDNLCYLEFEGIGKFTIKNIEFSVKEFTLNKIGRVASYSDIEISDFVTLRKESNNESEAICKIDNGEEIEILDEVVVGKYILSKSYIWHKIKYKNQEGFVLSSFIEIEGQSRDRIIEIIKSKAKENGIDENIVLALAGCESRYKVYACGGVSDNPRMGRGVFQLGGKLIIDFNTQGKIFYSPIDNPFYFNQNISAGVKYFNYLYNRYYKNSSNRLDRSVAAYNTGITEVSPDGKFNLNIYADETKRLVNYVSKNIKRKNWLDILWPVLLIILLFGFLYGSNYFKNTEYYVASISGISQEEAIDRYEKIRQEFRNEEIKKGISWNYNVNQIEIYNKNKEVIYDFPVADLNLDEFLKADNGLLIEGSENIFVENLLRTDRKIYFSATKSGFCGSGGCSDVIYELDFKTKGLRVIASDFFGSSRIFLSSGESNAALVYTTRCGFGCGGSYVYIIDLLSLKKYELKQIEAKDCSDNYLDSFSFINNKEIKMTIDYWNCGGLSSIRKNRTIIYNLETDKINIEKEEIISGAG